MPTILSTKVVPYAVVGSVRSGLSAVKLVTYAVVGGVPSIMNTTKLVVYGVTGGTTLASTKVVAYGVIGLPEEVPPTAEGDCCVPALNRLIELRLGPMNSIPDLRIALNEVQNRVNVLIREWNKLAAISQDRPPSV